MKGYTTMSEEFDGGQAQVMMIDQAVAVRADIRHRIPRARVAKARGNPGVKDHGGS